MNGNSRKSRALKAAKDRKMKKAAGARRRATRTKAAKMKRTKGY